METERREQKKRLMFTSGEDFYFFTYTAFVLLDSLGCRNGIFLRDHRKIAYLIPFVSDKVLIGIIDRAKRQPIKNAVDREYLFSAFSSGPMHELELGKLMITLGKRGYVETRPGKSGEMDVTLIKENLPADFLKRSNFSKEYENTKRLKELVPRINILTKEKLMRRLYDDHGVTRWSL
ncbi:hypothetical protein QWY84_15960 [Aquisalimonas lutea]|uniref:hypothetical protein n=1 Tax=Aquisalimonas lutea TaxID=1327750 RepID=UPI0025B2D95E|nr:hypothetical protein [Aquisalimonas lutea]MDN3519111.1 hypothetical protein [Aquisalimonas lutea]